MRHPSSLYTRPEVVAVAGPASGRAVIPPPGAVRPRIMGVLNVTPDSLWAGSRHQDPGAAGAAAAAMVAAGAHLLDIGAVSTRPGADPVPLETELQRLLPVLAAVRRAVDCAITVDTSRATVAAAALAAGADAINDVSGLADPELAHVVARTGVALIVVAREPLARDAAGPPEVCGQLRTLVTRAAQAGIPADRLVLDPGFGFGKSPAQNLALVAALPHLRAHLGLPFCVGPSRKGTIAAVLGPRPAGRRRAGTAALVALCAAYGADLVRVHDVAEMAQVAAMAAAVGRPTDGPPAVPPGGGPQGLGIAPAEAPGRICLRGLRIEACHGVLPEEHFRPQPFLVDLDLECDLRVAASTDRLEATLNYATAAALAAEVLRGPHRDLIETLAGEIARRLLAALPALAGGAVVVHKPAAPLGLPFADVSVRLPFTRAGGVGYGRGGG